MQDVVDLGVDRRVDLGMGVAGGDHGDAGVEVEEPVPVEVLQDAASTAPHDQRVHPGQRRAGHGLVAGDDLAGTRAGELGDEHGGDGVGVQLGGFVDHGHGRLLPIGRPTVTNVPGTSSADRGANLGTYGRQRDPDDLAGRPRRPGAGAARQHRAAHRRPGDAAGDGARAWIVADRRAAGPVVRRPAGEPAPRPRRPVAARSRPWLLHDRLGRARGQCAGRRGPAADRSGAAALPVRRLLPRPGAAGPRRTTACATCSSACSPLGTSRSPVAGTRCSATPTSPSSRRPRRSRHTCRGRSASPSPSPGPPASACRRAGRTTPSSWAASGTPR